MLLERIEGHIPRFLKEQPGIGCVTPRIPLRRVQRRVNMRHTVRADGGDMKTESMARSSQPRSLGRLALAIAIAAIALSLGAIAIAIFRELSESDPWSDVSALSALAV
ncbi:unnamed protein product, partial [marine sediment metagenome]